VAAEREQLSGAVAPVVDSDLGRRQSVNSQIAVTILDLVGTSLVRKLFKHHQPHTGCKFGLEGSANFASVNGHLGYQEERTEIFPDSYAR